MGAVVRVGIMAPFPMIESCHHVRRHGAPELIGAPDREINGKTAHIPLT